MDPTESVSSDDVVVLYVYTPAIIATYIPYFFLSLSQRNIVAPYFFK